jgi:hypothetical protein
VEASLVHIHLLMMAMVEDMVKEVLVGVVVVVHKAVVVALHIYKNIIFQRRG